jgi:hypothetical protein
MQYRLRTLLILLGVAPPMMAVAWWLLSEFGWIMAVPLSFLFVPAIGRLLGRIATRRQRQEAIARLKARGVKLPKGFDDKL